MGIRGGAPPPRAVIGAAALVPFAAAGAGDVLGSPTGAGLEPGGAPANPSRSNENPDGGGPDADGGGADESKSKLSGGEPDADVGEADESKSKLSGGEPPIASGCGAQDRSSATPRGGVRLAPAAEPGCRPGSAQALD